jgi:hypothetical protein
LRDNLLFGLARFLDLFMVSDISLPYIGRNTEAVCKSPCILSCHW